MQQGGKAIKCEGGPAQTQGASGHSLSLTENEESPQSQCFFYKVFLQNHMRNLKMGVGKKSSALTNIK